jgi:flagellar hook-length control protein FliK
VTRDAIEQALPRLREMFLENGLNLGEANVSEQGMGPQADTGREAPGQAQADSAGDRLNAEALESAPETRSRRVIDGLVDTFV